MESLLIAVITCKRPIWLNRLLECLQQQRFADDLNISILVVDNAVDHETKNVANKHIDGRIKVRYEIETKPGIVFARNKCISEAITHNADYLVFIDDDEWPRDSSWVLDLVKTCRDTDADIVTSHVISVDKNLEQNWATSVLYPPPTMKNHERVDVFYTNNLLLSKRVFKGMAPCFDNRFAMTGASDYHFSLRCKKAGFICLYTNAPVIEELPESRANVKWFCKRGFRSGIGYTRAHLFEEQLGLAILRSITFFGVRLLRGVVTLIKALLRRDKGTFVDGLFRVCSAWGTLVGLFGVKHNEYSQIHGK